MNSSDNPRADAASVSPSTRFAVVGRRCLVTGGGSGIGRATSALLSDSGARVAVLDRDLEAARRTADSISGEAIAVHVDVRNADSVRAAVAEVVGAFGGLDTAVNAAGIPTPSAVSVAEMPIEDWRMVNAINLDGTFFCMKWELQAMLAGGSGGSIVNLTSTLGLVGQEGSAAYAAAKHGVVGLTRSAALEYGKHGIRVNAVAPSFTLTPMLAERMGDRVATLADQQALGRLGDPADIAASIVFLASDDAAFTTGSVSAVDGGFLAR